MNFWEVFVEKRTHNLDEIDTAASAIEIQGSRYPEEMLRRSRL